MLNLDRWRKESIHEKLLTCLRDNPNYVWCWDQYALNVVFAGQWKSIPAKWNQGAHLFEYPTAQFAPIPSTEFDEAKNNPAIVHFTTEFKPWKHEPFHPNRERFFEELDQTAWAGWRPEKPPFSLKRWWDLKAIKLIRNLQINYRKIRNLFQ